MITIVQQELVDYLTGHKPGRLAGFQTVQFSDANVPTEQHPAITVDWDGGNPIVVQSNQITIALRFAVTAYVVSMLGEAEADKALQDLLLRLDPLDGQWKGLLAALGILRGFQDIGGLPWTISIDPQIQRGVVGTKKHQHWTLGAQVLVTATSSVHIRDFRQ